MAFISQIVAIVCYVIVLLAIGVLSSRKEKASSDYITGRRSLNFWVTAFAAHASDMSAWLFIGFPAMIFTGGLFGAWMGVGLILFMFLNWRFVAKQIRIQSEKYGTFSLSSFFEQAFGDKSGLIRISSAMMSLVFYVIYIAAGSIGAGLVAESLFGISYTMGVLCGLVLTVVYLFIGGYRGIAWVDCFQAIFLLVVVLLVPAVVWVKVGGWGEISSAFSQRSLSLTMMPKGSLLQFGSVLFIVLHWGIGYFGQPHIITKFMGIRDPSKLGKSMAVGVAWQVIALGAATIVGMIAVPYFLGGGGNPETLFITMVQETFPPVAIALILCGVMAAILSTLDSQILILASSLTEDFYKGIFRKSASNQELMWVSRLFVLVAAGIAFAFAFFRVNSIYNLVFYAWSGLGAAFGPVLLFALFSKKGNKYGALAGILVGGTVVNLWYFFVHQESTLIAGFLLSSISIKVVSWATEGLARRRATPQIEPPLS